LRPRRAEPTRHCLDGSPALSTARRQACVTSSAGPAAHRQLEHQRHTRPAKGCDSAIPTTSGIDTTRKSSTDSTTQPRRAHQLARSGCAASHILTAHAAGHGLRMARRPIEDLLDRWAGGMNRRDSVRTNSWLVAAGTAGLDPRGAAARHRHCWVRSPDGAEWPGFLFEWRGTAQPERPGGVRSSSLQDPSRRARGLCGEPLRECYCLR